MVCGWDRQTPRSLFFLWHARGQIRSLFIELGVSGPGLSVYMFIDRCECEHFHAEKVK